jgi:hypothetical protein
VAGWRAFEEKLLKSRDCFLTDGDLAGRCDLASPEVGAPVTSDLSLRLKKEAKRRILEELVGKSNA